MMHYRYLVIFFVFLGISVSPVFPQKLKYRSDLITRENGLSNSSVSCILKDRLGFLWFGTWNGLNRYDGYDITVFQANGKDTGSLSNSNISTLFEDKEGLIWIATDNGLNCYNPLTGKFKRFYFFNSSQDKLNNQINSITQDYYGMLWIGCQNGGLISLDKFSGSYNKFINTFSDRSNSVIAILPDKKDRKFLWLGTADGLFRFNRTTGTFDNKSNQQIQTSLSIQAILQDNAGDIFIGTWGNGLLKYNSKTNQITPCFTKSNLKYSNEIIRNMSFDSQGNIIFALRDKGIVSYNPLNSAISELNAIDTGSDLILKAVTSIYVDSSGIIWAGTIFDGVVKIVSLINNFKHYNVEMGTPGFSGSGISAILEDSENYLWLGTWFGGLARINRKTNEQTLYRQSGNRTNQISNNNILSLVEVREGNKQYIWIGTDGGGLNKLDPKTGKFNIYKADKNKNSGPSSNSVSAIIQYDKNHLLIGTRDRNIGEGLDVFNMRTGKFVNVRYDPEDSTSLGSNNIYKIFKDRKGTVWIGTRNGGLNKFIIKNIDGETPEKVGYFIRYVNNPSDPMSLSNNTIYSIHDDAKNNLWIGTNDGGLSKFDPSTGNFTSGFLGKYVDENLVYGILADEHENLWVSTSRGILVVNLNTKEIHSFDKYDGLLERAFINGSYYKSDDGEMFFGGIQGCNSFHPDSIIINLKVPEIVITSMNFTGKKGSLDVTAITGKSVNCSKSITIPYYQNNFSITFSALDFKMPVKNRYKYMLEGYDEKWIETDSRRRYVNYTNLPPGKYTFHVIGSNSDDIWNHNGTSVSIYITPPFWKTTTFYVLAVIFLIVLVVMLFIYILKKVQHEKKQVELEAQSILQDERKQLRTLIDNIPDLIFIKDRESRFTMANIKIANVMHTTPDNLIGKTDFDFYDPDIAKGFYDDEQKIMRTGTPMINCEENAIDENGNRIIRSITKVPVKNKNGEIIGVAGICRDITHFKKIEAQLRKKSEDLQETNRLLEGRQREILIQSEELEEQTQNLLRINEELDRLNNNKDKFFSIIAHDLRNPFNAIIGFCELLRNDFYEMEDSQKLNLIELVNVSSQTAYNLLENLLQWAKTQTDRIVYKPENFDLYEVVNIVNDLLCVIIRNKGITIKNNVAKNTIVHADKNMVNTVIRNLVCNAAKFSNPEGEIEINAIVKNDNIEIRISDNGIGMNKESLSKLFKIDTYYSTAGTMGETGTGLGLILCKEFVEKNNGRIKAHSIEGHGTTMTFTLTPQKN